MRYLFSAPGQRDLLARIGRKPLLGFDLDGTLAMIRDDPDEVRLSLTTRTLLRTAASRFPLVVISGRARADVLKRLDGITVREVYGNHGIEPRYDSEELRSWVAEWGEIMSRRLSTWSGVWVENKTFSVTVHYRQSPEPASALAAAEFAASTLSGARIVPGKFCLNLLPARFGHKGSALLEAQSRFGCESSIYVGDDETDEDVFSNCDPSSVLGVRIGNKTSSRASYYLRDQTEIDLVLSFIGRTRS